MKSKLLVLFLLLNITCIFAQNLSDLFKLNDIPQLNLANDNVILDGKIDEARYILTPGDIIKISISGLQFAEFDLSVSLDGYITIPKLGAVYTQGKTFKAVKEEIVNKFSEILTKENDVSITLVSNKIYKAQLYGEFNTVGLCELPIGTRLTDAIALTKGLTIFADISNIVIEGYDESKVVDLTKYFLEKDMEHNPLINAGDKINCVRNKDALLVSGSISRWDQILYLDAEKHDYKASTVDINSLISENRFYLQKTDCGLSELLSKYCRFEDDFSGMLRLHYESGTIEVVNWEQLEEVDVNLLKEVNVLAADQSVFVSGYVNKPQSFPYNSSFSLRDYIGFAGGIVVEDAGAGTFYIMDKEGNEKEANLHSKLNPGDLIIVKKDSGASFEYIVKNYVYPILPIVISIMALTK